MGEKENKHLVQEIKGHFITDEICLPFYLLFISLQIAESVPLLRKNIFLKKFIENKLSNVAKISFWT
jgi:hypothetical protein